MDFVISDKESLYRIAVARFLGQVFWTDWLPSFAEVERWVFSKYRELGLCLLPLWLDRSCRKLRGHHPAGGENPKRVALPILDVKQVQDTHVSHVEEVSIGGCLSPMWHPQAKGGPEQQHRYSRTAQGHGHAIGKIETRAAREAPVACACSFDLHVAHLFHVHQYVGL